MGHSASIAKKYQAPPPRVEEVDLDDTDSLATVSSFRPTSPEAHSDAREFILQPVHTPRQFRPHSFYGYPMQAPMPVVYRTGSLGHRINGPYSSASIGTTPIRSVHDVRHYLVQNPELLAGKNGYKRSQFHDITENPKQIKTKQQVYLGLLDPPMVYGYGVDLEKEKQLKVKQKVYLQLMAPAMNRIEYITPAYRSNMPMRGDEMVVVRRDDMLKKLNPERGHESLPAIRGRHPGPAEGPKKSSLRRPPQELSMEVRREPASLPNGSVHGLSQLTPLQSSTPVGAVPKRRGNEYVDMHPPGISKSPAKSQKQKKDDSMTRQQRMEVERRYKTDSVGRRPVNPAGSVEVVFNYDVDELGLKKRSHSARNKAKGGPPYHHKSLPDFTNRKEALSGPL